MYSCTVIPSRGAWLEYETDANDVFYVHVDRNRKLPISVFIRALGIGTDEEIKELLEMKQSLMPVSQRSRLKIRITGTDFRVI